LGGSGDPPVWVNAREPLSGARAFDTGKVFEVGRLRIETRLTSGHSPGGTTYVLHGLGPLVALTGDALFCCSQGGAARDYVKAIERIREGILSLPETTVLCPGHGPMTTVAFERAHNPFHAGSNL